MPTKTLLLDWPNFYIVEFFKRNFLGEAYKREGKTEQAIELFRQAEKIMNNPDFTKDMEEYIISFQ